MVLISNGIRREGGKEDGGMEKRSQGRVKRDR